MRYLHFVSFAFLATTSSLPAQPSSALFAPAVTYGSGGPYAFSIAVADVNSDGMPDLLVVNQCADTNCNSSSTAGVLLGKGDGTFRPVVTYGSGGYQVASSVAVADVNGDGKPDLLVGNEYISSSNFSSGSVGVLLGNGDGTFQTAMTYGSGGPGAPSVAVGDVNDDGKSDLLLAASRTVGVLLGNGDGTFQTAVTYGSGGLGASSIAVADINLDGKPDLLVANIDGTVGMLLGNGEGTFKQVVTYGAGGYEPFSVAVADLNGDDKPDLVVANHCESISTCTNGNGDGSVGVLVGNGDGTFKPVVTYGSGGELAAKVAIADVNGDGKPDLVVANECAHSNVPSLCVNPNGTLGLLLGNGNGTFQTAVSFNSGGFGPFSVAVADVNGDGKPDLLASNFYGDPKVMNGTAGVLINTIPFVQRPINSDGSSIFNASRGVIPVKFNNTPTCTLLPATISVTRTAGAMIGLVDASTYSMAGNSGSNFRIDPSTCQYIYNLATRSLGVGVYRVDIAINGITVGSATFALK